jgi:hypothetical protein
MLLINFIFSNEKILFLPGIYDIFFFPCILILLSKHELNFKKLFSVFEFISLIVISIFFIQLINQEFYIDFFLNNLDAENIDYLFLEKAYNPKMITHYNDTEFVNLNPSIFNNPGRFNHFVPCFFLIMNFFYLININKFRSLIYMIIFLIIIVFNSSRFSIILALFPILVFMIIKVFNKKNIKLVATASIIVLGLYLSAFNFFYKLHFVKLNNDISLNKVQIVLYHNFYEPVFSSFDSKRKKTASSITGRILIVSNHFNYHFENRFDSFEIKKFLFGNGIGKHSMAVKRIKSDKSYIYENNFIIFLYEYGILLLIIISYIYFSFIQNIINNSYHSKFNIINYFKIISIYPFLLFITGFQFYRDFAFQFFYFFLMGLVINFLIKKKNNEIKF